MKRFFTKSLALALIVMLLVSLCSTAFAFDASVLSTQKLTVNGEAIDCEKYNIDGNNYFKLRDLAYLLNGTNSQFAVDYDEAAKTVVITTGEAYKAVGGELEVGADKSASTVASAQTIKIDGETVTDLTVYNIGGNNYFKLRDLGKAVGFYVHYDEATRTMLVDESEEDEAWDTGDASKDDPRNADGIGETEVLVVSFGTSFNDSRVATIGAIEAAMEKAFPELSVRRGFTANIVINHIARRDGEIIDDITEALDRAVANGVKELYVQPTHLMAGYEYDDVVAAVNGYKDKFDKIVIGKQILDTNEDFEAVVKAITEATAEQAKEEGVAVCFMGHGTEHKSNAVYAKLQDMLTEQGYSNYYIGTVEAEPSLQDVVDAVKAAGYKKVYLEPLMIVAGDHANNDMADPDDDESWVSLFAAAGIEAEPILRGLGELPAIQDLLVKHMKDAMEGTVTVDAPTRDIAAKADMNSRKSVEKEGASPITADKLNDGTYDITVATGNSMFRISNAKLTVKDGKMTATFNTSKSYTWLFMGKTDDIAAADENAFLKGAIGVDGVPGYTVDVEALNQALDCSSYSKNKDQWYPNVLMFDADSLPAGALK